MSKARIVATFIRARWGYRFRSRKALERYQLRQLRRQLRFLAKRSPLFQDVLVDAFGSSPDRLENLEDLARLPLMDKQSMMANFDRLNTVGAQLADVEAAALGGADGALPSSRLPQGIVAGLSSGTSGHRGVFVTSPQERDHWAGTVLAMTLPHGRLWGHRIALFLRAGNELYDTVRSRAIDFRFYDTHGDLVSHARDLAEYNPTILVAPPSVLDVLAEQCMATEHSSGIALASNPGLSSTPMLHPQRVYSVAEVLTDADGTRLAQAFSQEHLHQLYQCTEGLLAHTCERGTLHLNEQIAIFEREWLDDRRFVPIVTDFRRRTQPIVRYRLNDILQVRSSPCDCGSVLTALERIEGREDDTLIVDGTPVFADVVARAIVRADGFTNYRVRQFADGSLEVALDDLAARDEVARALAELWARLGLESPVTDFIGYVHNPTQKLRRVQRVAERKPR
ncbi:putative adenylate-forming enzyme [Micrococcales bacterium KH10]|nr:putative adenylate-forming enzyme [Micrococcales bacterium KH10]